MRQQPNRLIFILASLALALSFIGLPLAWPASAQNDLVEIEIHDEVIHAQVKDLGVNLGKMSQFGAAQFLKNPILNPGFEGGELAMIVLAGERSNGRQIEQDNWESQWTSEFAGQPEGFWDNASYEILTGPAAGRTGTVKEFSLDGERPLFILDRNGDAPDEQDAIMFRGAKAGLFTNNAAADRYEVDREEVRPESPGEQSLRLLPGEPYWTPSYLYVMDSYSRDADYTAGKLYQFEGNWHFEIWAKAEEEGAQLNAVIRRENGPFLFLGNFEVGTEWTKLEQTFYVPLGMDPLDDLTPQGHSPALEFSLNVGEAAIPVWVDDLVLERTDSQNGTVFSDKYVGAVSRLEPGIVRNWGNQLGSSLDNQLAPLHGRKTTGYHPRERDPKLFHFSLHEFLELALEVDAEPWYVIPPTFDEEELENLIAYLSAPAGQHPYADLRSDLGRQAPWTDHFDTIHLEFGNEMWGSNTGGDQFMGATLRGGERVSELGGKRLETIRDSRFFDEERYNLVLGGQMFLPYRQFEIESTSQSHDTVAIAPYFGELEVYTDTADIYYPLFARPFQDLRNTETGVFASQRYMQEANPDSELSIYEINFHTTTGDAPLPLRNEFVTGINSGIALPFYMLVYQRELGIMNQNAFQLVQYSIQAENGDYTRLWGLMRDIEASGRKRPTYLGLELANQAIRGRMLRTEVGRNALVERVPPINGLASSIRLTTVEAFAYQEGDSYAAVLFNLHQSETQQIELSLPRPPDGTATLHILTANSVADNNEESQRIGIRSSTLVDFAQGYELSLPPHSMLVLEWGIAGSPQAFVPASPTPFPVRTVTLTPQPTWTPVPTETPVPTNTPTPTATPDLNFVESTFGQGNGPYVSLTTFVIGLLLFILALLIYFLSRNAAPPDEE